MNVQVFGFFVVLFIFNIHPADLDIICFFKKERALESFERMASIMKTESKGKTGFAEIKEVGTSLLSGIANVIVASASLAKDTKETGIAGNDTQYERVSIIRDI